MDPDSTQQLIDTASKAVIQLYAYLTMIIAFLSALAFVALVRLPRDNSRFFLILFLFFWVIFLFVTAFSLLMISQASRARIIIVCCVYLLMPGLILVPWFDRYFLFVYQWIMLTCWAWPSLGSGTCSFLAPEFLARYGVTLAFVIALFGFIAFTALRPIKDIFQGQNRLETLLEKKENTL